MSVIPLKRNLDERRRRSQSLEVILLRQSRSNLRIYIVVLIMVIVLGIVKPWVHVDGMNNNVWSHVDVVYYINLDHRQDRKQEFLAEMSKVGIPDSKVVRIAAIADKSRGDLGCSKSHVLAMETFLASSHNNCIIFEDDFGWQRSTEEVNAAFDEFFQAFPRNGDFDVMMLSANEVQTDPMDKSWLRRVINVQTASGYMVSRPFAPTLLENFRQGARELEAGYDRGSPDAPQYAVDQYWKRLQPETNWYMFYPKLGKQRSSFSDIVGGNVDYGV